MDSSTSGRRRMRVNQLRNEETKGFLQGEAAIVEWLSRGPRRQVLVCGVEAKATLNGA